MQQCPATILPQGAFARSRSNTRASLDNGFEEDNLERPSPIRRNIQKPIEWLFCAQGQTDTDEYHSTSPLQHLEHGIEAGHATYNWVAGAQYRRAPAHVHTRALPEPRIQGRGSPALPWLFGLPGA